MSNKDYTINQLAKKVTDVSEKQLDYSSKKKIIEPLLFKLFSRIQNINSFFGSTHYNLTEYDTAQLLELVYKSASTKGQIYRYIENWMWRELISLPFNLNTVPEDEIFIELESNSKVKYYNNEKDRINQLLIDFCFKILDLKQKKQNNNTRREYSLKILGDLLNFYNIPKSYDVFRNSIKRMDSEEQYQALEGFERYFLLHAEKISDELLSELRYIFETTKKREIASTCLEIEINIGLIGEIDAVIAMDDWNDEDFDYDE